MKIKEGRIKYDYGAKHRPTKIPFGIWEECRAILQIHNKQALNTEKLYHLINVV